MPQPTILTTALRAGRSAHSLLRRTTGHVACIRSVLEEARVPQSDLESLSIRLLRRS